MRAKFSISMLTLLGAATLCMGVLSCSKDDGVPQPEPEQTAPPSILVNGLTENSLSFEGSFGNGKSGIDFKQTITISSNVAWTLSGVPDWLFASPTNGNGTITMTIYPKDQNESASSRNATLILSGNGVSAIINIVQGNGLSLCYVEPTNIVTLHNCMAWDYKKTDDVNKFHCIILLESEYNRMTDKEMIIELNKTDELKFIDNYVTTVGMDSHNNKISPNSTYYIVTLAYDSKDNIGELRKTKVSTPALLNDDKDAWVGFENILYHSSIGFWFDAKKEGYCNTYHLIYGILPPRDVRNPAMYAFEINYYIKNMKKHWFAENWEMEIVTDYPNNHTFTYNTIYLPILPTCIAYGWGIFKDGKLSSSIVGFQYDISNNNVSRITSNSDRGNENRVPDQLFIRSVEQARAKEVLK